MTDLRTPPVALGHDRSSARVPRPARGAFTPTRVVALIVIAVLACGLAVPGVSGDPELSVPAGAQAGDLIMDPCTFSTPDGSYAADCGTLVVPENRRATDSRLIALPVTRVRATGDDPAEPVFPLEGGPGLSNTRYSQANELIERHDIVLVGYRGVDGSSVLDCPEVESALKRSADLAGEESMRRHSDALVGCSQRLADDGVDLAGYSLPQRVDDLEAVRTALGYERINLISESAGTRTAMIYSWRYPERLHRSVMIGVNPPGHFVWDPEITDEQLGHYADLCAQDESCATRTDDLLATMRNTAAEIPDRWWFLPIKEGNVRAGTMHGLFNTSAKSAPLNAPTTIDTWLSGAEGDPSGFWLTSLLADVIFPESFVWGELASSGMIDAEAADAFYAAGGDPGSVLGGAATDFLWGGGGLTRWPASPDYAGYRQVQTSPVETLLIGGSIDLSTPTSVATDELLPHLPNGHQVILTEFGHTSDFWNYQPEARDRLLTTFFDTGQVDDSLYTRQEVEFDVTGATHATMAKIMLGALAGLALLAVTLLAWMRRRVRRRGGFGPKASAWLRVVAPLLLGLGGWFLALLIVVTIWPAVSLGSQLVAVLSMGIAVGGGIYLAWVKRDWSAGTRYRGLAAALTGALVGAWLGFHVLEGVMAALSTLVAAAVAANLALIVLDIIWHRSGRDRAPAST